VSSDTAVDAVPDERGDVLESVFWGAVFAVTLAMFYYEFVLGVLEPEEAGNFPIATIVDFKQAMFLAAVIGGGGVVALVVYSVFRFGSGVRAAAEPLRPGQGSLKLAVFVLAVFAVMSTTIFQGAAVLAQTDEAAPQQAAAQAGLEQQIAMDVTAAQWFWRFDVAGVPFTQAEQVVLPADTLVHFRVTSADVVHSFSVKELGITKDAMPGSTNEAWFSVGHVEGETTYSYTANGTETSMQADTYEVRCAELCGKGHSKMVATIYVVEKDDYETWVTDVGGEAAFEATGAGDGGGHGDEGGHGEEESGGHDEGTPTETGGHDDGGDH
jgi:cytochrome c oxidase subunit 2